MELDRRGAELLFQVLTEREEKNSVAIASNESFSGWTKTFTDPRRGPCQRPPVPASSHPVTRGTSGYALSEHFSVHQHTPQGGPRRKRETRRPNKETAIPQTEIP
jgi:hypothetical protein